MHTMKVVFLRVQQTCPDETAPFYNQGPVIGNKGFVVLEQVFVVSLLTLVELN
jgi:hypothetical protein